MELWLFSDERKHPKKKHLQTSQWHPHDTTRKENVQRSHQFSMFSLNQNRILTCFWPSSTVPRWDPEQPKRWLFRCGSWRISIPTLGSPEGHDDSIAGKIHHEFNEWMYFLLNIRDFPSSHLRDFKGVIFVVAVMIVNPHPEKKKV